MNEDGTNVTYSSAAYDSTVGIQAETVHNSTVNFVSPDASPQEKYRVGLRFLDEGVPSRARDLISEAIAHGYDNAEVRFHWVLAMLSARDHHDLSAEEGQRLRHAFEHTEAYSEGEWKDALRVAFGLIGMPRTAKGEEEQLVLERLHNLDPRRRDAILHHLDLVLAGELKEGVWAEYRKRAEAARFGNNRIQRAWAYFVPDPIGPRALPPRPSTAAAARAALPVQAGLFVVAAAFLGILALIADPAAAVVELLVALGAGLVAARSGRRWWYQKHQLGIRVHESLVPYLRDPAATGDGFTNRVRHSFDYYFSVRVPHGFTAEEWLGYTLHVRNRLVAEIAFLYRESRISVDRVNWLIRYLAEDARERHNKGTLFSDHYQNRNETPAAKALCVIALIALGITTQLLLGTIFSDGDASQIPWAILAVIGAVWSGHAAASRWLEAEGEDRRIAKETQEYQERLAARKIAYDNWKSYLAATRPTELEMETWLTCDKTLFVDEALRHYQLTWRDLIAHTILMTPARPYKRGRVRGGPWRYSRYGFRLFLVTQDGVREISMEFDFTDAKCGDKQRSNYRFDALSSVQVSERTNVGYDLELVLTNGPARSIRVKDADTHQLAPGESAEEISEINLDAAGFTQTFRLLEGIAADGKGWIERNSPHRLPSFGTAD
ncbi:hypothetical protein ACFV5N_14550 [Streptomyces sp. NPDC059853]|uniref:hypothetical protein n=1 Tax=Streptomyces sp. NPDC059853 TaxID=3346973 RepID=UPI00365E8289